MKTTMVAPADVPGVIVVGAVDDASTVASFSSRSSFVDVAGPGVNVWSASAKNNNVCTNLSGTSMASPFVAGVVANMIRYFGKSKKTPAQIRHLLIESAQDRGLPGYDET